MSDDPTVEPIASLAGAQVRLRHAAAEARAVAEWLRDYHLLSDISDQWARDLGRIALDLDTLAHAVQLAGEID